MNKVKVSIIIVSYNSGEFIKGCIEFLLKSIPNGFEVIVLDNASSDDTVFILKNFLPKIKLIESDKNLGFAKGNNQAAKLANGEYLFFLNPDTYASTASIKELVTFYESQEDAGIVAPKVVKPNGTIQPTVKNLPTIWKAIKEYVFGVKHAYSEYVPSSQNQVLVESVYGAAMLIKKDLYIKLGGFDEKYFLYYEDADLCKRARDSGKKIYYYPRVTIRHLVGATKSEVNKYDLNYESFVKYHGWIEALVLQVIFLVPRLRRKLHLS